MIMPNNTRIKAPRRVPSTMRRLRFECANRAAELAAVAEGEIVEVGLVVEVSIGFAIDSEVAEALEKPLGISVVVTVLGVALGERTELRRERPISSS